MRVRTNEDNEPPVTLLHGNETEIVLKSSLQRIKIEQAELLEAQKRKAREEREEGEETESNMEMEETKDEQSVLK